MSLSARGEEIKLFYIHSHSSCETLGFPLGGIREKEKNSDKQLGFREAFFPIYTNHCLLWYQCHGSATENKFLCKFRAACTFPASKVFFLAAW